MKASEMKIALPIIKFGFMIAFGSLVRRTKSGAGAPSLY